MIHIAVSLCPVKVVTSLFKATTALHNDTGQLHGINNNDDNSFLFMQYSAYLMAFIWDFLGAP